jgi:hypothetical protein
MNINTVTITYTYATPTPLTPAQIEQEQEDLVTDLGYMREHARGIKVEVKGASNHEQAIV